MRRTKEDAEQTRRRIIAAARSMFARRGVTRTTLEQVARAARVTRGAVYWHFANKTELFYAMREEVSLPLIDRIALADEGGAGSDDADPLVTVERFLSGVLKAIEEDAATRETFDIVSFKCEYVGAFDRERRQQVRGCSDLHEALLRAYRRARRAGVLAQGVAPDSAALETCAFLSGLVRLWLLDEGGLLVRKAAARMIAEHVRGKRGAKAPLRRDGKASRLANAVTGVRARPRSSVGRAAPRKVDGAPKRAAE